MAIDPDSEIITAAEVGDANKGDGEMMPELLEEFVPPRPEELAQPEASIDDPRPASEPPQAPGDDAPAAEAAPPEPGPAVYGDSAYGGGASLALLEQMGATPMVKVQGPHARTGCFTKDRFVIDLAGAVVTCPNNVTVALRPLNDGGGHASFGKACSGCPLRAKCTTARDGRVISVSVHEALLQEARQTQADHRWQDDYKSTRPKVERKQAHCMRRRHGGRKARVRGKVRVAQDFKLLAAAGNFARLAVLGVASTAGTWAAASI
jgi:hypothetical protein